MLAALNTTVYSAATGGGTVSPAAFVTDANGQLPGYVEQGSWVLTVSGTPFGVEALSGASMLAVESGDVFVLKTQAAEGTDVRSFRVIPATAGFAPFEIHTNSFANTGAGAGTRNHAAFIGWNSQRHGGASATSGKPAMYMGFEDNYFDPVGDLSFGSEWYVGYVTPDGTTIGPAGLRPFYTRVEDSDINGAAKSVHTHLDIGSGPDGQLTVYAGIANPPKFVVTDDTVQALEDLVLTGNLVTLTPATGQPILTLNSASGQPPPAVVFRVNNAAALTLTPASTSVFDIFDKDGRLHIELFGHSNIAVAQTLLNSSVKIASNVGFYGTDPIAKPTGVAVTAGGIHAALVSLGLIAA